LLFDYRVKHRGLGNRASISRPMIYITYGTKAWSGCNPGAAALAHRTCDVTPCCLITCSRRVLAFRACAAGLP
jgi:hypothetical protein